MPSTYTQIGSAVTVGSGGAASIDFTSIPSTYTDLAVLLSVRTSGDQPGTTYCQLRMTYNGSSSGYSYRLLYGIPSVGAGSLSGSSLTRVDWAGGVSDVTATASTFASNAIYIPNYAASNNKSASHDGVTESNSTLALATLTASLWSNSAAINQITFTAEIGSFVEHSTVNCTTGEVLEIALTDAEVAELELQAGLAAQDQAEQDALAAERATAKAALLDRLGITADEAALLLS
jgi:hypothetical protein